MRFGILTQYYSPEIGAPQARLSELAGHFVRRGHQVTVLTAMPNYPTGKIYPGYGGLFRREEMDGVEVIRTFIYPTKKIGMLPRLTNYFSFVFSSLLIGAFALPRMDFLLTESPPLFLGISGYLLSRFKGRWIFNVSDLWPDGAVRLGLVREGLALQASWALERFCYEHAWRVSGQSREILENVRSRFPGVQTYHLSNGVDTSKFSPERRSQARRQELGQGRDCVALYAGLHGVPQGLDQILNAADQLRDQQDLAIVFVGDGPEKERLEARAQQMNLANVRFLPPAPRSAMAEIVASADIALVPLKQPLPGAVPSKLYEAMGSSVPVVCAAGGEGARIVEDTGCGLNVTPGDGAAMAAALRELAANRGERIEMGHRGRTAAVARFDRRRIADAFIDTLEAAR